LTKGDYPARVQAVWEPAPLLCTTDECRNEPVAAPQQGSRWVAWVQFASDGVIGAKSRVNLRGFFSRPYSAEARTVMAQQCMQQGKANDRILRELRVYGRGSVQK
jgi:hypothetical protein